VGLNILLLDEASSIDM
jgi:hypothetical protein